MDDGDNFDAFEDDEPLESLSTKELTEKLTDPETEYYDKSYMCYILSERKDGGEDISAFIPALKKLLLSSNLEAEGQEYNISLIPILIQYYAKGKNWNEIKEILEYKNDIIRKIAIGNLTNFIEEGGDVSPLIPYFKDKTDSDSVLLLCMHYLEKGELDKVQKYYQGVDEECRVGAFHAILETAKRGKDVSFFMRDILISIAMPEDVRTAEMAAMISVYDWVQKGDWNSIVKLLEIGIAPVRKGIITAIRWLPVSINNSLRPTAFKKEHIHPILYKLMEAALYDKDREVRNAASKGFTSDIRQTGIEETLGLSKDVIEEPNFMNKINEENRLKIKVRSLLINDEGLKYIHEIKEDITPLLIESMTDSAPEVATNSTNILLERLKESVFEKIDRADYFPALQEIKEFTNMANGKKDKLHPKLRRGIITYLNDLSLVVQNKINKLDDKKPMKWNNPKKDTKGPSAERKSPVRQR